MKRRDLIVGVASAGLAGSLGLAQPAIGQSASVLRFVPQANLANPDPVWTTTGIAANHAYMVWDQLWGFDVKLLAQPQMLVGVTVSDDKLTWRLTLREGLLFHDGEPVRSTDCIPSLVRWMKRDGMGQRIDSQLNEMRVIDDRSFEIVLKKPFPLLPMAFANNCHIMPERIAKTSPFEQITEYVGSGPFRFLRDEWVSGSLAAYARFDKYKPRDEPANNMAGGKRAYLDRVEWHVISDPATAAAALQTAEIDWIEQPLADLLPALRRAPGVTVESVDLLGNLGIIRFNELQPPFNNQKMRQALLAVVNQKDFMTAIMGDETALTQSNVGIFAPGTPLVSNVDMDVLNGPRDVAKAKRLMAEAGYKGEKVVILAPTDYPVGNAMAQVTRALCDSIGLNVDYVTTDWGTLVARRASREPVEKGGWSIFNTWGDGFGYSNPATYNALWGTGDKAWFGWPTSPRIEALRDAWYDAPDLATQQRLGREMQKVAFEEVPFIPVGAWRQSIARRDNVTGILLASHPLFWEVKKT